jgi:hypothetical protein
MPQPKKLCPRSKLAEIAQKSEEKWVNCEHPSTKIQQKGEKMENESGQDFGL